jgi:hypothetical protein
VQFVLSGDAVGVQQLTRRKALVVKTVEFPKEIEVVNGSSIFAHFAKTAERRRLHVVFLSSRALTAK